MANRITFDARPEMPAIRMQNGLTDVFVEVLAMAASQLARTRSQQLFASWIASRDQAIMGSGAAGFDAADMPWRAETFAEDRIFLIRAVAAAEVKTGWQRLDYEPGEEWLMPCLAQLRLLLSAFDADDIRAKDAVSDAVFPESNLTR